MAEPGARPETPSGEPQRMDERLQAHPELRARFEMILAIVENAAGEVETADEAERRAEQLVEHREGGQAERHVGGGSGKGDRRGHTDHQGDCDHQSNQLTHGAYLLVRRAKPARCGE